MVLIELFQERTQPLSANQLAQESRIVSNLADENQSVMDLVRKRHKLLDE